MLFCTLPFLLFFAIVLGVYWALPWHRARVLLLLAASFYFYASWSSWLALIVCATTVMDYLIARGMEAGSSPPWRRLLLALSLGVNLGLLGYFKYANFFLRSLEEAVQAARGSASLPVLEVILPIGISFYTFEAINYTVDVYRRRIPAERNLLHFMLFILFFPHLVAGPIVRARDFLPQVGRPKRRSWPRMNLGGRFVLMGLFKKLVIADRMGQFADPVFADPTRYGSAALWLAALAYAFQVFCDFSGYSDLALGTAHMLGFKLTRNFNLPYLSANIAEFWRRWHISLSTWMRDYLFIPLGGSRCPRWKTYRNLLVTMTLGGLWHGASWPFVLFGVIQGLYLILHRVFRSFCERRPRLSAPLQSMPGTALRVALTFVCFLCSLVVFRAVTVTAGMTMLTRMLAPHEGLVTPLPGVWVWSTAALMLACHLLALGNTWQKLLVRIPAPVRGMSYAAVLAFILLWAPMTTRTFIYFQF